MEFSCFHCKSGFLQLTDLFWLENHGGRSIAQPNANLQGKTQRFRVPINNHKNQHVHDHTRMCFIHSRQYFLHNPSPAVCLITWLKTSPLKKNTDTKFIKGEKNNPEFLLSSFFPPLSSFPSFFVENPLEYTNLDNSP